VEGRSAGSEEVGRIAGGGTRASLCSS